MSIVQFNEVGLNQSLWRQRAKLLFLAFLLFMLTNPCEFLIKGILPGAPIITDPNTTRVVYANVWLQDLIKVGLLSSFLLLALTDIRAARVVLGRAWCLILFFAYALCSLRWSDTPSSSVGDLVYLATAISAGVALAVVCTPAEAARSFAYAGVIIGCVSLFMIVFMPAYGKHQATELAAGDLAGNWRGVYMSKNVLGQVMATFFVIYAVRGRELFGSRWMQLGAAGLSLLLVLESRSVGGLVVLAVAGGCYGLVFALRGLSRLVVLSLLPLAAVALASSKGALLEALGRGSDLSGRAYIWPAAMRMFAMHPLLGFGYGSATMGGLTSYIISRFKAQNTHNGYLDLALSSGIVGSSIFYAAIGIAVFRAAQGWRPIGDNRLLAQVLVTLLGGWSAAAFSEVSLRPNTAMGALGIAALVPLSCLLAARRAETAYPHAGSFRASGLRDSMESSGGATLAR